MLGKVRFDFVFIRSEDYDYICCEIGQSSFCVCRAPMGCIVVWFTNIPNVSETFSEFQDNFYEKMKTRIHSPD